MDILHITREPGADLVITVMAAYRPIYFGVLATVAVPPTLPMYADVIFNGDYYKTITSYTIDNVLGTNGYYEFDIQELAQEYLTAIMPPLPISMPVQANDDVSNGMVGCVVRFRGASIDSNGLLVPNGPIPVQATATSSGSAGVGVGGTYSMSFSILNASIMPDGGGINDNALEEYLELHKVTDSGAYTYGDSSIYALSNLPKNSFMHPDLSLCPYVYQDDSGFLPILIKQFYGGLIEANCWTYIFVYPNGSGTPDFAMGLQYQSFNIGTWYLPTGLADLLAMTAVPADVKAYLLKPSYNAYYRIGLYYSDQNKYVFFSPLYKAATRLEEGVRLCFQNMYGHYEQVTFARNTEDFITTSAEQFVPYAKTYDQAPASGRKRYNVRAHEEISLMGAFSEGLMPWLKELMMSPMCYQFYTMADGGKGVRQVEVLDGTFATKKTMIDGRFSYEVTVKIRPSVEYVVLR